MLRSRTHRGACSRAARRSLDALSQISRHPTKLVSPIHIQFYSKYIFIIKINIKSINRPIDKSCDSLNLTNCAKSVDRVLRELEALHRFEEFVEL